MFKSYFTIAFRNLARNKSYSIINISGLAVGIAACILIGLFVYSEISFDNNIPDRDRIYRLNEYVHYDGTAPQLSAAIGPPIASFLKENHGEIESYTRVMPATPFIYPSITLEYEGKKIVTTQLACTDTTFPSMFGTKIMEGNKDDFVRDRNSIVLTQSLAVKIFGNTPALHKVLALHAGDTTINITVSNVIADFPKTSHLQLDGLIPVPDHFGYNLETNYGVLMGPTYLRLKPGTSSNNLEAKLTNTIHAKNKFIDMRLQPLRQVHTKSTDINYDFLNDNKMDGKYINIFSVIALAIFVIAWINFINLTIAIAGYRGKEIAIKKIVGARRVHIILQVLTETFVSVLIAVALAVFLATICLPLLNSVLNRELTVNALYQSGFALAYGWILVLTTLLAGSYPAWLIATSKTNRSLKGQTLFGGSRTRLRNLLVTGQFVIAGMLVVSLVVFLKQLNFLQNKNLGYSYSQVIRVPMDMQLADKLPVIRAEFSKIKGVESITHGNIDLGGHGSLFGIDYVAPDGENKHVSVNFENTEQNYFSFFGMEMVAGPGFDKTDPANEYVINETLAKQIGYTNPVDKPINLSGGWPQGRIVGVVRDFNYSSLHGPVEPLLISAIDGVPGWERQLYIKLSTSEIATTLKSIETQLKAISGNDRISMEFMDEHFKEVYNSERQAGILVGIIGGLAISIACLGLLSLAAFIIARRTKEIGIRKVVGASASNIAIMLSKDFLKLVLIAMLIAFPAAWWSMNTWLQGFAYRIPIGLDIFLIAGALIIFITLFTVSFQSIRAALANPVKSLRTD